MKDIIKTICLVAVIGLISFNTMAQKTVGISQAALNNFSAKYPQALVKNWKEKQSNYLVRFTMDGKKYQASYSKDGNWLMTERNVKHMATLPPDLRTYLKSNGYASWNIDDMKKIHSPGKDEYQLHVDNHSGSPFRYSDAVSADDRMLSFDVRGKLIEVKEL
jgi:hypothetical protein